MKKIFVLLYLILFVFACRNSGDNGLKHYYGAEVYSRDAVLFGKFEVRAKLVNESGMVSSFFLYDNVSWQGEPYPWREIDFESIGREKDLIQTNIITGSAADRITSEAENTITDLGSAYHTYTIEWTPDYVAWLIDGTEIRRDTAESSKQVIDLRDTPQTYRMNLWIAEWEDWVGPFRDKSLPQHHFINWIKYYEYTPDGADTFTHKWTDDFDTFDDNRWGKGEWSFEGNLVMFAQKNVQVIDGYLVLCLTEKTRGFTGTLIRDE